VTVEQLVPTVEPVDVGRRLDALAGAPRLHAAPFHPLRIAFSDAVSRELFRHPGARAFPELSALAFWLRRAAVTRLAERFRATQPPGALRVPRGLVFHVPPTNVDTLFAYSLLASVLVGNINLVRVSRHRPTEQVSLLCEVLRETLAQVEFSELGDELSVIAYGHEPEPTALASARADVRLLWGGDDTVRRLRAVPVAPGAHELTFGDRFSFAALHAAAVLDGDARDLAERLFNDAYWFDQLACASPRLLIWVGDEAATEQARPRLLAELEQVIADKGYRLPAAAAIAKLTFVYGAAIDRQVRAVHRAGNELVVICLEDLNGFDREHPGGGVFFDARIDTLGELVGFVERRDQTMTTYGFAAEELTALARSLRGGGVDRIVSIGSALSFDSLWDGYDLLAELTRTVAVSVLPISDQRSA
jgi:hypothetical protein